MTVQHPTITSDPQRRGGRPCVRDLRISVGDVLGWLAEGQTTAQIVADQPRTHARGFPRLPGLRRSA